MSEDSPVQLAGFRAGSLLAGYRLEAQVGAGGMAVVFRARDERLDRLAALKILAPALASDEDFRTRFIAESRAAAAVDDPYIIPVYEAGEAGGVLFIAMRFVQGGDLRQVLEREGALPAERAAGFISPVASALDAAHRAGLVHRDVKPGNILVDTRDDRPDHVYLSDFGVAKAVSEASLTGPAGYFIGTPDYAAPEQIRGLATSGRADQYALACVAFQLLAGDLPFRGDQGTPALLAHVTSPPPPLTGRRPDLPAAVDQVMARALAKDPAQRYATCLDFAGALREALGLGPFDPEGPVAEGHAFAGAVPQLAASAVSGPDTVMLNAAGAVAAGHQEQTDPVAGGDEKAPTRPARPRIARRPRLVAAWARRHRLPALALACAVLAAVGGAAFALASPTTPPTAASSRPAAELGGTSSAHPTTSASPVGTAGYTSVPIKLPSPYKGQGIVSLAFGLGGTTLAIADDQHVCLWNVVANTGCRSSSDITAANAVAFSSDGKTVAVGGRYGRVALFNASTLTLITSFTDPGTDGVVSVAVSPNGKTVAAGDDNGNAYLWNVATGKGITLPDPKSQGAQTVVFSPDGKTLFVGDLNGSVYLWDVRSGKLAGTLTDPGSKGVDSTALSPDGKFVAAGDINGNTYLWNVATKTVARVYPDPFGLGVNTVAFSPDGKLLATADENGAVFLWDSATLRLVHTLDVSEMVEAIAFTPDSKTLAISDQSGDLTLWHMS